MAVGMITTEAGIGVPINSSIRLHLVGRIAVFVVIFSVLLLDRRRIAGTVREGGPDNKTPTASMMPTHRCFIGHGWWLCIRSHHAQPSASVPTWLARIDTGERPRPRGRWEARGGRPR